MIEEEIGPAIFMTRLSRCEQFLQKYIQIKVRWYGESRRVMTLHVWCDRTPSKSAAAAVVAPGAWPALLLLAPTTTAEPRLAQR